MFRILALMGLMLSLATFATAQQKIDPKKPKIEPKQKWDLEGFIKEVEKLTPEEQIKTVREKMRELNPGFVDYVSHKIEDGAVIEVVFDTRYVENVSPIRAFSKLRRLEAVGVDYRTGRLTDLSPLVGLSLESIKLSSNVELTNLAPLKGMPLLKCWINETKVSSLVPLQGCAKLEVLVTNFSQVTNLKPLKGLKLKELLCSFNKGASGETINDLSALKGMKLQKFSCDGCSAFDYSVLKEMPLELLQVGETPISDFSIMKNMPLTELHVYRTRFTENDGVHIKNKQITTLGLSFTSVRDLKFTRDMPLVKLICNGCPLLGDLQPLKGKKLVELRIDSTPIQDLKPLENMPLTLLSCLNSGVVNLAPLKGMRLNELFCGRIDMSGVSPLSDLSPLAGMPLVVLWCQNTSIKDLSPLAGMPLVRLHCHNTAIKDLKPLAGTPIVELSCQGTKVVDFGPLKDLEKLSDLRCDFVLTRDRAALKAIKSLQVLNGSAPQLD